MKKHMQRCIDFLKENGWVEDTEHKDEHRTFNKDNCLSIDINLDEIVFLDDSGDCFDMPVGPFAYYALLGFLMELHQIDFSYKSIKLEKERPPLEEIDPVTASKKFLKSIPKKRR